ncbi:MAG: hypothetical protein FOGNACKC_03442 [Anaerolineae bacterium]|nr:hypothetical protein [Anaerolineae bacterium]
MPSEKELLNQIQTNATKLAQSVAAARFWYDQCLAQAERQNQERLSGIKQTYERTLNEAHSAFESAEHEHKRRVTESEKNYQQTMAQAKSMYEEAMGKIAPANQKIINEIGLLGASWSDSRWNTWSPTLNGSISENIRFGRLIKDGRWGNLEMPALLSIFSGMAMLFKANGAGKDIAVRTIQSIMLRLLAAIPPGKLRFTFIDPVGLGQNVAAFMHLADYDDALVTARAWTQEHHIEQRLTNLTEHMENVIQKYLRNQYQTIEDYNTQAGEVAEPYRVLAVLDFPVNFSEAAARQLVSIAQNGPRCGVHTLVMVDTGKPLPHGFNLNDLERFATVFNWEGQRFRWDDNDFRECLLELDTPPQKAIFDRVISQVGETSKESSKVEVPFARVIPSQEDWWSATTLTGLRIPLGPSGARKLQHLELGAGTAQHTLVVGKTGSGKTNLLHVLITNLALRHSPSEMELYLVDFKKGVGFKPYAVYQLPHARVIAIESEREFGLSVLQGLDTELKRRGDQFRSVAVDNLAAFREKTDQPLTRILLIVDEFQEFFVEDDTTAAQASQILDRLVRQGRAFGIHVLLGSQTLAGTYSLARSTIDQMAVRIALQCSEADSRLILGEDNPAARLLSRPGEAIYNDANGLVEGNNLFQVVRLPDDELDKYLFQIQALAQTQNYQSLHPQIIFEGNAPAEVEKNKSLTDVLSTPSWPASIRRLPIWLGDPIAIKDATTVYFRRQSGSNLLIVGQNEESALGILSTAVISLATHHAPDFAKIYIVDLSPVDAEFADSFSSLAAMLPHSVEYGRRRKLVDFVSEISTELNQRLDNDESSLGSAIYLVIFGLQRARDLRQSDDFGFSSFGIDNNESPAPNPAQQFPDILREGPELGIHTLVWCDTVNNLNRTIDRGSINEFEMRVAFQMGNEDSVNLIDTPAASRIGPYRALYYNDEEGRLEKFRPYGLPSKKWLSWVDECLKNKIATG